ncbi:MAG: DUF1295 domain-containing protein [Bacteroidota bacterium]|nr:DUF1295 domain-containing protein [Bacteroidota bacterium]
MALQEELEVQGNFCFKYRGLLPIIILLLGLGIFIYKKLNFHDHHIFSEEEYTFFSLIISLIGFFIRIYTVGHSPENTSGRNTQTQVADQVNTTGIYSIVRHPLYLGNFFMWLGIGMLTESIAFIVIFILFFWIYYERIMFAEEQFLRKKFNETYLNWSKSTPAFIPSFKKWICPRYSFSWKKVLKKEKNGFFALFLVFFLFDYTETVINTFNLRINFNFWFYGMLIAGLSYLILKFLKKKTNLLYENGR